MSALGLGCMGQSSGYGQTVGRQEGISSFSSIGWIFSRGSDAIPFPQPKPRTVRIHVIMPSVCSRKVAQLEWSGVRKGENMFQPFNLRDRLLGIHSASIFTRKAWPKESGFGQKLKRVPTGGRRLLGAHRRATFTLATKADLAHAGYWTQIDSSCKVSCCRELEDFSPLFGPETTTEMLSH